MPPLHLVKLHIPTVFISLVTPSPTAVTDTLYCEALLSTGGVNEFEHSPDEHSDGRNVAVTSSPVSLSYVMTYSNTEAQGNPSPLRSTGGCKN